LSPFVLCGCGFSKRRTIADFYSIKRLVTMCLFLFWTRCHIYLLRIRTSHAATNGCVASFARLMPANYSRCSPNQRFLWILIYHSASLNPPTALCDITRRFLPALALFAFCRFASCLYIGMECASYAAIRELQESHRVSGTGAQILLCVSRVSGSDTLAVLRVPSADFNMNELSASLGIALSSIISRIVSSQCFQRLFIMTHFRWPSMYIQASVRKSLTYSQLDCTLFDDALSMALTVYTRVRKKIFYLLPTRLHLYSSERWSQAANNNTYGYVAQGS